MKFIENIADSDFVGSIQRYIKKVFEVLSTEYDKNPKLYLAASTLIAVFVIAYISYSAGKRSRDNASKIKKHIRYDEIDWSVQAESETEDEAKDEAAVQAGQLSPLEQSAPRVHTGHLPAASPLELPRQTEEPADVVRRYLRGESGITLADKPEYAPVSTLADKPEPAPMSMPASASEPAPILNLAPLYTPEPTHIHITESYEPIPDTPNNPAKQETESVKVEQINLIKAVPYRKFGADNRDTNRSGRIFTEEELRKQIRD